MDEIIKVIKDTILWPIEWRTRRLVCKFKGGHDPRTLDGYLYCRRCYSPVNMKGEAVKEL
jgi:hypothetical protein